jgi:hypothetical protein
MIRIGRGLLNAKSYCLRLERIKTNVVNVDNKWLSCGEYETSMRDPVSMGFYALCPEVLSEFYPITQAKLWVKAFRIIVSKWRS